MSILDYFRVTKAQPPTYSPEYITNDADNQLRRELDAHLSSIEQELVSESMEHTTYNIDHWELERTQTLPQVTWAPMDKFPARPAKRTQRKHGHGYVRYDEAMILRPLSVTTSAGVYQMLFCMRVRKTRNAIAQRRGKLVPSQVGTSMKNSVCVNPEQ